MNKSKYEMRLVAKMRGIKVKNQHAKLNYLRFFRKKIK